MGHKRLARYPALLQWYLEHQSSPPADSDSVERFIYDICHALTVHEDVMLEEWSNAIRKFFSTATNTYQSFCDVENALHEAGMDFMELATDIAEHAVRNSKGEEHYNLLSGVAQACDVAVFRFLAAWTALNCGKLDECIHHCEAVEEPFACVYTLLGQAQLEKGDALGAIESLEIAAKLSPKEVLALFQLAKAYHVTDQHEKAWQTLEGVNKQIPQNPEVEAFFAMIALTEDDANEVHLSKAWEAMCNSFSSQTITPYQVGLMLDLAFVSKRQDRMSFILNNAPWDSFRNNKEFMANVPWILKKLDDCGWRDLAAPFLDRIAS